MSLKFRYLIESTLRDLKNFVYAYAPENKFKQLYNYNTNLAEPTLVVPFKFYLMRDSGADSITAEPKFELATNLFNQVIELVVQSLEKIPRLELFLFPKVKSFEDLKYPNPVAKTEDFVQDCLQSCREILLINSFGLLK